MNHLLKKCRKTVKGFTLIELIVVIAILALLAAVAIPKYNNSKKTASNTAHLSNVKILESAGYTYLSNQGLPELEIVWSAASSGWNSYLNEWPDVPKDLKNGLGLDDYTVTISVDGTVSVAPDESQQLIIN